MKKILVLLLVLSLLSVFSCSTTDSIVKEENISQSVSEEVSVSTPENIFEDESSSEESEEILSPDTLPPADETVDNDNLEPPLSNPEGVGEDGESRELPPEVAPQSSDGTNAPAPDDSHLPGDVPAPGGEQAPEEAGEPKEDNVPGDIPAPTGNAPDMVPPRDKENAQTPGEIPPEVETGKRVSSLEIFLVGLCVFIFLLIIVLVVIMIRKPSWYRKKYDRED